VAVPIARQILQAYFQAHPLPESGNGGQSDLVTGGSIPGPPAVASPRPSGPPGVYRGRVVAVRPWEKEISILTGRVVDRYGQGAPGVQIALDGGGPPVAQFATGPNGEFHYDYLNPLSSPRWNIRLPEVKGEPVLAVQVESFKHYVIEFREGD